MANTSRHLTDDEIRRALAAFAGPWRYRDRALFIFMLDTGLRISEALSLHVGDVMRNGIIFDQTQVAKNKVKGKTKGHIVWLTDRTKDALRAWLNSSSCNYSIPLFCSAKGRRAISRIQAYRVFKKAFDAAGVYGVVSPHSCRKTFAKKVHRYNQGDVHKTMRVMGHMNVQSTVQYLESTEDDVRDAFLKS